MPSDKCGLFQVYTGDGKGKSTAAFGLALRAAGHGMKTVVIQFMKQGTSGEVLACKNMLPLIEVYSFGTGNFIKQGNILPKDRKAAEDALDKAASLIKSGIDILILDELNTAVYYELVDEGRALDLIKSRPINMEVISTGRYAPMSFIENADLVTEMREITHPYSQGIAARCGIEF